MRSLGEAFHEAGALVIGLRIPGHGTTPAGLKRARWEDMAGAVKLAAVHLREKLGERPLFLVGYSNGGALAIEYALSALEDPALPAAARIVLVSPEIGVSKLAPLAVWQERLGRLLGLQKLAWNSINPEYDPFKYGSFAVNAGTQAHRLTTEITSRLARLESAGGLAEFPPVLAFQSLVDATVSTPALIEALFQRLPDGGHELVLFDINRVAGVEPVLQSDPKAHITEILKRQARRFTLSVLTNRSEQTREVVIRQYPPGVDEPSESPLDLTWPIAVYSLSHVALPFPEDDPVYGRIDTGDPSLIRLGDLALRGERGVLRVNPADMLRLRWNPFHTYLTRRALEFVRDGVPVSAP
jgi:alpha-beta hydrolase superfamily lysophospholipase